jgi:predicted negative regulator of RcsB-dependent stress response
MSTAHADNRARAEQDFALKLLAARRDLIRFRAIVQRLRDATMSDSDDAIAERAYQKALATHDRQVLTCARLDEVIRISDEINEEIAS